MKRWLVRAVFGAAVAALPLQVVVREVATEPYPGLYQPSFGGAVGSGDTYVTLEPRVSVTDANGATRRVDYREVLPPTSVLPRAVLMAAFRHDGRANDPETAQWLRERLILLAPGSDPRSATVEWVNVERQRGGSTGRVVEVESTRTIDVGQGR